MVKNSFFPLVHYYYYVLGRFLLLSLRYLIRFEIGIILLLRVHTKYCIQNICQYSTAIKCSNLACANSITAGRELLIWPGAILSSGFPAETLGRSKPAVF